MSFLSRVCGGPSIQAYSLSWQCEDRLYQGFGRLRNTQAQQQFAKQCILPTAQVGLCIMQPPSLQRKSGSLNNWTICIAGQGEFAQRERERDDCRNIALCLFSVDSAESCRKQMSENKATHVWVHRVIHHLSIYTLIYLGVTGWSTFYFSVKNIKKTLLSTIIS